MNNNGRLILFTVILVAVATICKFYLGPNLDWSGFSPVIAIALFSGFIVRKGSSFILPLLALFISDATIQFLYSQGLFKYPGLYSGQWLNYLFILSATLIGWLLKGKEFSSLVVGAIAAPTIYFLISNFTVWMGVQTSYPKNFNGLIECYVAGLPFYKNALIATLVFLPGILLLYNYLTRKRAVLTIA